MNRQTKRSLEPSAIPKRSPKQQVLCDAIEQNHQNLERTIQVYVKRVVANFGDKFDLNYDNESIQIISTDILQNTVETVLNKSEKFELGFHPLPWIKGIAVNKVRGWQRDKNRSSEKVVSIGKFARSQNNLSEEELLGILSKSSRTTEPQDSTMMEYLLSLVNESDRQVLKLAFIDDLNGKGLAAALGISEGAANVRKNRAVAKLRKAYTQENPDCQEGK